MGKQVRVQEALKPVIRLLKEAYDDHMFTADEAYAMAHYMAYEMPEELRQNVKRRVSQRMALMAEKEENEGVSESVSLGVTQGVTHKDERSDKEKRTKKEIIKKEEKGDDDDDEKKSKKEKSFFPSLEEVKKYHKEIDVQEFTAEEFYDYYQSNGWLLNDKKEIKNWKAVMRSWVRRIERRNQKQQDNERRQTKGAGAKDGATREELQQAIIDYLDTHYPVADSGAEDMVAKGMGRDATLGEMAARLGQAPVLRLVTKRLFMTGYEMDLKPSMLRPQTLEKVAAGLCHTGWQLTMKQVNQFLLRCEEGTYGDFRGGLKTTTVLPALKKFISQAPPAPPTAPLSRLPRGGEALPRNVMTPSSRPPTRGGSATAYCDTLLFRSMSPPRGLGGGWRSATA